MKVRHKLRMNAPLRRMAAMALAAALSLCACSPGPAADLATATAIPATLTPVPSSAVLRLVMTPEEPASGDEAVLTVVVEGVEDLLGVELALSYDPAAWEILDEDPAADGVQVALGGLLKPDFVALNLADPLAGTIKIAYAQSSGAGVEGGGALALLRVRALQPGDSAWRFTQTLFAASEGSPIPVTSVDLTLTVK